MAKRVLGLGVAPTIFATVCVAAMSTIVFVHHNQKSEKEVRLSCAMDVNARTVLFLIMI